MTETQAPQGDRPVTALDERFSDPASTATGWDETREALEAAELFWISTVRADGRPHMTPLVAVWHRGALYFCTGATEQKAANLRTNPHVIVMTGCNRWDQGLDVIVEGEAVQVTDNGVLEQLAEAWSTKWDGRWHYHVRDGGFRHEGGTEEIPVFAVAATKVLAFAKGEFSQTRHQF